MPSFLQIKTSIAVVAVLLFLSACEPQDLSEAEPSLVAELDLELLPDDQWQLSNERLQLSFCRNLINEGLLGAEDEIRRWRLTGDASAFPQQRQRGLSELARIYAEYDILLWQESGTVSSQFYRLVTPTNFEGQGAFSAVAELNQDERLCFIAIDEID